MLYAWCVSWCSICVNVPECVSWIYVSVCSSVYMLACHGVCLVIGSPGLFRHNDRIGSADRIFENTQGPLSSRDSLSLCGHLSTAKYPGSHIVPVSSFESLELYCAPDALPMTIRNKDEWTGLRKRRSSAFGVLVGSMLVAVTWARITVSPSLLGWGKTTAERSPFPASEEHLQFPHLLALKVPTMIRAIFCLFRIVSTQICPQQSSFRRNKQRAGRVCTSDCLTVLIHSHTGSSHWSAWEKGSFCPLFFLRCPDSMSTCPALPQTFLTLLLFQVTPLLHFLDFRASLQDLSVLFYIQSCWETSSIYLTPCMQLFL
jgi:hypothetical protein